MGSPTVWYKAALQNFAYLLLVESINSSTQCMSISESVDKMSIEELETTIRNESKNICTEKFFFNAGIAMAQMIEEADKCGCGSLNASAGGAIDFQSFIGLYDDETEIL